MFDIDEDMFFTKEELVELGEVVIDELSSVYPNCTISLNDVYADSASDLTFLFEVYSSDLFDSFISEVKVKVDFRRIRSPRDLMKYKSQIIREVSADIDGVKEWLDNN